MNKVFLAILAVLSCMTRATFGDQHKAKFEPGDGKTLLFIGQTKNSADNYATGIGRVPFGVMLYTSVQTANGLWEPDYNNGVVLDGQYLVGKYPAAALQIGLYMVGASKDVKEGRYDGNLEKLINWTKTSRRPTFLRIGYECDWTANQYDPSEYREAYKYIVNKFRGAGVDNVAFVWHSAGGRQNQDPQKWYPGDEYVDWMAVSHFDEPLFCMDKMVQLAHARRKPLMIAESAPRGQKTSQGKSVWNFWFKPLLAYIERNNIKGWSYINDPWDEIPMWAGQGWGDSRIEANKDVMEEWKKVVETNRFKP